MEESVTNLQKELVRKCLTNQDKKPRRPKQQQQQQQQPTK